MDMKRLGIGVIGIGVGAAEMLPVMEAMDEVQLVAGADVNALTRQRFQERYPWTRVYESAEKLCADEAVDAVWVSSPNRFHVDHALAAIANGKHVVVEKPMALSIEGAEEVVAAAEKQGVVVLAGHTQSYSLPIRAMRRIISSGKLGPLHAIHILSYSDWMLRPRSAEELDLDQGGGIPYRQGPHQVDTVRLLGGGKLERVRAMTGQWMPERPIPGYYCAYLEFQDGTASTIVHNGYGYFLGAELVPWGEDRQRYSTDERVAIRRQIRAGSRDEETDKQELRIGGTAESEVFRRSERRPWVPDDLGFVVVSCERGDIRHSKYGLYVYDDDGVHDIDLPGEDSQARSRRPELEELYDGVVNGHAVHHDGAWGMATLEACLAIMESAKTRQEVHLSRQIPIGDDYDSNLMLPYLDD